MFENLKTAFSGLGGLVGKLKPSPGTFQMSGVDGTIPDATGGGWDANVKTAFAHPGNGLRRGVGAGLMGLGQMAPTMRGAPAGGMSAFTGILPLLMQLQQQGRKSRV